MDVVAVADELAPLVHRPTTGGSIALAVPPPQYSAHSVVWGLYSRTVSPDHPRVGNVISSMLPAPPKIGRATDSAGNCSQS
jgi:hypothetical protein